MVDPIKISLDFYRNNSVSFNVKQLDDLLRIVEITCTSNGKKVVLDNTTTSAFVRFKKPDNFYVVEKPDITSEGIIRLILKQSMLSEAGRCIADVMLINSAEVDVENIEDIINSETLDGVGVISTMSFYANVEATAIDHSKLAGVYKKDDFVDIASKLAATDNYAKSKEQERQNAEVLRVEAESARSKSESERVKAESDRESRIENFISSNQKNIDDSINEYSSKMETSLKEIDGFMDSVNEEMIEIRNETNTAKENAEYWAGEAESATNNANNATTNANNKVNEMQELMDDINQTIGGVINDDISSESTTYSSQKIDSVISNFSNSNLLINGDFQVWQRGIAFDLSKNKVYTADRWCITGFSPSATNTVNVAKANNGIQITIDDGNVYRLTQYLEAPFKEDETYTISAKIDGVVYSHSFKGGDGSSSTDKFICGVVDGKPFVQIFIIGETVIEWVKLEQCPVATPFIPRLYEEELLMCQRYYYVLPYSQYIVGFASDKRKCYLHSEWAVNNMRNDKTIINKTGNITICHSGATQHAVNVAAMTWEYGSINITVESDICTHQAAYMYYNSATGYIAIDAEIY